jgi:ABC-type transport system substrate-binding protein
LTEFIPFVLQSYITAQYLSPVFQGLYERDASDPNFALKPLIASAMPVFSTDKKSAVVSIRDDVYFSNGNQLNATDVVNTYRMDMTPAVGSVAYSGLTAYLAKDSNGDYNSSVSATGEFEVTFKFSEPYFLATNLMSAWLYDHRVIGTPDAPLGGVAVGDTNQNATAKYEYNLNPLKYSIGTGPFVMTNADNVNHQVKLEANGDYWNAVKPKLTSIEFNKFGNKEAAIAAVESTGADHVDIIDAQFVIDIAEVEDKTAIKYNIVPDFGTQMMVINMGGHPIMGTGVDTPLGQDDPTRAGEAANYIRLAISHATPRDTIVDEILKGVGTTGTSLWPDIAAGYNKDLKVHEYDLELAKEYMAKAGYTSVTGGGFLPLDMTGILLGILSIGLVSVVIRRKD